MLIPKKSLILLATLLLTACAEPKTSVERNARHVSSQVDQLHFDPNTRPLKADNIRLTANFLRQFYDLGKKDRTDGLSQSQAERRVASFSAINSQSRFINQKYSSERPEKQEQFLREGATAVYWDGYNGRP